MARTLAVAATILLSGCASAPTGKPAGSAGEPLAVIDAHVQTSFTGRAFEQSQVMDSKAELAAEMKRYHVVGAVSMDHPGAPSADLADLNVVHCVGLPERVDVNKLGADLTSRKYRCIAIYLADGRRYASDPDYEPAYRFAEKYHVPVVFQTEAADNPMIMAKSADPLTVGEVAVHHPKVTFVVAHAGNPGTADQRDRSDWLRRHTAPVIVWKLGDDPWIAAAATVASKNPNVVLDGSAFLIGDLLAATPEQIKAYLGNRVNWVFRDIGEPSKLMFGTAWPRTEIGPYLEVFKRAIPREHWQAVFHDNAARVYGFERRPRSEAKRRTEISALALPIALAPTGATAAPDSW